MNFKEIDYKFANFIINYPETVRLHLKFSINVVNKDKIYIKNEETKGFCANFKNFYFFLMYLTEVLLILN